MSLVLDGTAGVTFPASQTPSMTAYQGGVLTSGTVVASTSGTSITFSSIPSWAKRITVMFNGVSTSGTSLIQIQVGAGSVTTSGYAGTYSTATSSAISTTNITSGFGVTGSTVATDVNSGAIVLALLASNTWVAQGSVSMTGGTRQTITSGSIALGGSLDRVVITTVNGTDTFDAGSINILYE